MINSEQLVCAIRNNIDKLIKGEYIAVYIIGSVASGDFVHGRSDCDVVVVNNIGDSNPDGYIFNTEVVSENDATFRPEHGDVKISVCYRSYDSVVNPIGSILAHDSKQMLTGKELGAIEDSILIVGQGIFISGKDIRDCICLPDEKQFAYYLKLVENLADECITDNDVVALIQVSKNIMLYAKHFYYMWTKKIVYSSKIVEALKAIPEFDCLDILDEALKISQMTWIRCRIYLNRNPEALSKYIRAYNVFMWKCNTISRNRQLGCALNGMNGKSIDLYNKCYSGERIVYEYNKVKSEMNRA